MVVAALVRACAAVMVLVGTLYHPRNEAHCWRSMPQSLDERENGTGICLFRNQSNRSFSDDDKPIILAMTVVLKPLVFSEFVMIFVKT